MRNFGPIIPMVPRLHQSNGYMKRKLRACRVQKCISLVGSDTVLTSAWVQTTPLHGGCRGSRKEICETSGVPIPMVQCLLQSNGYMKRKLRAWRVQKCIALVGADTVLTSSWPQTTPLYWGYYRVQKGNMRSFGPTNSHGTTFSPKQWLHQNEAMDMESSKIYFRGWCRFRTYQSVAANSCHRGNIGSRKEICENSGLQIPMVQHLHQINGYIKRKLREWRVQKCIDLVGVDTVLTSAWPQTTPFLGG